MKQSSELHLNYNYSPRKGTPVKRPWGICSVPGDTLNKRIVYFLLALFEESIYSLDLYFCVSKTSFNGCGFRIF